MSHPPSNIGLQGPFHNQPSHQVYATLSNPTLNPKFNNVHVNVNEFTTMNTHSQLNKQFSISNSRTMSNNGNINNIHLNKSSSNGQTPVIRISDYSTNSNFNLTSMDDLLSLSGLDESNSKINLKYYNKALISYLSHQGLNMNPLKLTAYQLREKNYTIASSNTPINSTIINNSNIETFITGNGQILFLPFNSQKKKRRNNNNNNNSTDSNIQDDYNDDDMDNDNDNDNDNENDVDDDNDGDDNEIDFTNDHSENLTNNHQQSFNQYMNIPSDFPTKSISKDNGNGITYHTFGIIFKINKEVNLNHIVKVNYHTHANVKWNATEFSKKEPFDERYRTSTPINWNLDLQNPDCYIPFKDSNTNASANDYNETTTLNDSLESDSLSLDSMNNIKKHLDSKVSPEPTQKVKYYKPLSSNNYVSESKILINDSVVESNLFANSETETESEPLNPGYYIFLLPVVYPLNTSESIYAPNSNISHDFSIQIQKGIAPLPNLQAPQSAFLSTSPSHQHRFEEPKFDLEAKNMNIIDNNSISSTINNTLNGNFSPSSSSKTSFFKKIGIRRNSSSSSRNKSISTSINSTSISHVNDQATNDQRRRANSGASFFNYQNQQIKSIVYNYNYQLPSVRLPPSDATSTLNKSIYVNKVWNKALNYELLLPKKYTQLSPPEDLNISPNNKFLRNNTFMLQMKLVPLVKNLQLKRIKINIIEKITYTAKNPKDSKLAEDTKSLRNRSKETVTTLMEIKTREKPSNVVNPRAVPQKTEIVANCVNDNLLTFCYNNEESELYSSSLLQTPSKTHIHSHSRSNSHGSSSFKNSASGFLHSSKKMSRFLDGSFSGHNDSQNSNHSNSQVQEDVVITNPVKLQCPLTFVCNDDSKFISTVYENLCKGTSDITGLRDNSNGLNSNINYNNDSMSIFSVNSNDKNEVLSDDDYGFSKSPKRRARNFSFSSNNDSINQGFSPKNNYHETNEHLNNINNGNNNPSNNNETSLYTFLPDATFSNLKIRHRLQISFRISRPDPKIKTNDNKPKMHHYEVVVDTPIVFVSPFCVPETMNLPSYDDALKHGMFEMNKSLSRMELNSENDFSSPDNSSDENTVFAPCSPLMSSNIINTINNGAMSEGNTISDTTNLIATSPLSMHNWEISRGNSLSYNSSENRTLMIPNDKTIRNNGVDATSLLSATLSRSRNRSDSIHKMLSNKDMDKIDTIDGLMGLSPTDENKPPEYSDNRFKIERINNEQDGEHAGREELPPPPIYEEAIRQKIQNESSINISSNNSLRSERLGILRNNNETVETNIHFRGVDTANGNLRLFRDKNMSFDSEDFSGGADVESVMGDIASLNLTPTMNDR